MVKHRYSCPTCGGQLGKLEVQFSAEKSKPRHATTPYYYCMKCKKPMKLKFVAVKM